MSGGDTKKRIGDLEAEIAMSRQRVTDIMNENRHLQNNHPTLRDQFAMAALTGILVREGAAEVSMDIDAQIAFAYADAMIAARGEK